MQVHHLPSTGEESLFCGDSNVQYSPGRGAWGLFYAELIHTLKGVAKACQSCQTPELHSGGIRLRKTNLEVKQGHISRYRHFTEAWGLPWVIWLFGS